MPTYISLVQFTDKGIQAAKETTQRVAEWAAQVQSRGVSIREMYWSLANMTRCASSTRRTTRRPPACCWPRTCQITFAHRHCVLLPPPIWRRSWRRCPDQAEVDFLDLRAPVPRSYGIIALRAVRPQSSR